MTMRLIFSNIIIFLFLTTCLPFFALGQSERDSIKVSIEVDSLINLTKQLREKENFEEAIQSIAMAEQKTVDFFGKDHLLEAIVLSEFGLTYLKTLKYKEALRYYTESQQIFGLTAGKGSLKYAKVLISVAMCYIRLGESIKAEQSYMESTAIMDNIPGIDQQEYVPLYINHGGLYASSGQYGKAETLLQKSKKILEENGKTESPYYFNAISNLGLIYLNLNNNDLAIQHYSIALSYFNRHNLSNSIECATTYLNMGIAYLNKKEYPRAQISFESAKNIFDTKLDKYNSGYVLTVNLLGNLFFTTGNYTRAEQLLLEAKDIYEKIGVNCEYHQLYCVMCLGELKMEKQQYDEATNYFLSVLNCINESLYIGEDMDMKSRYLLFKAYYFAGNTAESMKYFFQSAELEKKQIRRASSHFAQDEMIHYEVLDPSIDDCFGAIAQQKTMPFNHWDNAFFDAVLFKKGYFLQSSQITTRLASAAPDSIQKVYAAWNRLKGQLADAYIESDDPKYIARLEEMANVQEKLLVQNMFGFAESQRNITWQDVQSALDTETIAIEFVKYKDISVKKSPDTFYGVLLLSGTQSPQFIPLFNEKELLQLTNRSKSWLQDYTQNLYAQKQPAGIKNLYQLIWEPLEPHLSGVKTIYYAPAGLLHRLNLEAIEKPDGSRSNSRNIVQLGSTRNILPGIIPAFSSNNALIFGGIQYDANPVAATSSDNTSVSSRNRSIDFSYCTADSTLRGNDWRYLPNTLSEVQKIETQLRKSGIVTEKCTGEEASEETFKIRCESSQQSPRIIHIATHGFFFPDGQNADDSTAIAFKANQNPMMRSGLILAGANHAWKTGNPKQADAEDGILTAYEISLMNLSNTELVVLSACETGLGDIAGNEGVYGLQRAFKIAGAKYLIMSLWKVSDEQTEQLMTLFYQKWLREKQPIPEAFRSAKAVMQAKYSNPFYWAGFVLLE